MIWLLSILLAAVRDQGVALSLGIQHNYPLPDVAADPLREYQKEVSQTPPQDFGREPWTRTVFASQHKTGTVLGGRLNKCLKEDEVASKEIHFCLRQEQAGHFNGEVPKNCKIVYIVRSPYSVIRSSYIYTSETPPPELWMEIDVHSTPSVLFSNFENMTALGDMWARAVPEKPLAGEGLHTYYNRVSEEDGITAEMLGVSNAVVTTMENAWQLTRANEDVLILDLESFSLDFNATVNKVISHFGVEISQATRTCVQNESPEGLLTNEYKMKHIASVGPRDAHIDELVQLCDEQLSRYGHFLPDRRYRNSPMNGVFFPVAPQMWANERQGGSHLSQIK